MRARSAVLLFGLAGTAAAQTVPVATLDWHRLPVRNDTAWSAAAYDAHRARVVLFESGYATTNASTWEWHGDAWALRRPALSPTPRNGHTMAYDPVRRRTVLFGGDR